MRLIVIISTLTLALLFSACNKEEAAEPIKTANNESLKASNRTTLKSTLKCPASYVTVTPCGNKFNFQLHYGPGGTGGESYWCFDYVLRDAMGIIIDIGTATHGGSTNPSPWVDPCETYYIQFTGCCGSIYPGSMPLTSDGCGGMWNC